MYVPSATVSSSKVLSPLTHLNLGFHSLDLDHHHQKSLVIVSSIAGTDCGCSKCSLTRTINARELGLYLSKVFLSFYYHRSGATPSYH